VAADLDPVQRFLGGFLYPLVSGGEVHINAPLDAEDLELLKLAYLPLEQAHLDAGSPQLPGLGERDALMQEVQAIELACRATVAELWPAPPPFQLGARLLELAVGAQNLLFLSHPVGHGWRVGPRGLEQLETFAMQCIDGPGPASVADLLNRHALLRELFHIQRADVEVDYWAGNRVYRGMQPPARLTAWPTLRRVRETVKQVRWLSTEMTAAQQTLLLRLLAQTPLTDLLTPTRPYPPFRWQHVARHLSTPRICRVVCNSYLAQGMDVVGPYLARAFWEMTRREPDAHARRALRLSGQLVAHLFAATCLTDDPAGMLSEIPAQARDPEAALGPILLAAAQCGLLPEGELLGDAETRRRLETWMDAWRDTLGQAAEELSGRLLGALY